MKMNLSTIILTFLIFVALNQNVSYAASVSADGELIINDYEHQDHDGIMVTVLQKHYLRRAMRKLKPNKGNDKKGKKSKAKRILRSTKIPTESPTKSPTCTNDKKSSKKDKKKGSKK
jgi:hypothetical protein